MYKHICSTYSLAYTRNDVGVVFLFAPDIRPLDKGRGVLPFCEIAFISHIIKGMQVSKNII